MIIARYDNGKLVLSYYQEMFPDVSFSSNGPNDLWFEQNECYRVSMTKDYNPETEVLVPCEPYLEDNIVYTVNKENKPTE